MLIYSHTEPLSTIIMAIVLPNFARGEKLILMPAAYTPGVSSQADA